MPFRDVLDAHDVVELIPDLGEAARTSLLDAFVHYQHYRATAPAMQQQPIFEGRPAINVVLTLADERRERVEDDDVDVQLLHVAVDSGAERLVGQLAHLDAVLHKLMSGKDEELAVCRPYSLQPMLHGSLRQFAVDVEHVARHL